MSSSSSLLYSGLYKPRNFSCSWYIFPSKLFIFASLLWRFSQSPKTAHSTQDEHTPVQWRTEQSLLLVCCWCCAWCIPGHGWPSWLPGLTADSCSTWWVAHQCFIPQSAYIDISPISSHQYCWRSITINRPISCMLEETRKELKSISCKHRST